MLIKLLPDQISSNWDKIKFSLVETTPELTARGLTVVLENLLSDSMQCWLEVMEVEEVPRLYAIVITSIFRDNFFQANCLRICSLYGFEDLTKQQWLDGYNTILGYAKSQDCVRIEAFTDREGLGEMTKQFGGTVNYHISIGV